MRKIFLFFCFCVLSVSVFAQNHLQNYTAKSPYDESFSLRDYENMVTLFVEVKSVEDTIRLQQLTELKKNYGTQGFQPFLFVRESLGGSMYMGFSNSPFPVLDFSSESSLLEHLMKFEQYEREQHPDLDLPPCEGFLLNRQGEVVHTFPHTPFLSDVEPILKIWLDDPNGVRR